MLVWHIHGSQVRVLLKEAVFLQLSEWLVLLWLREDCALCVREGCRDWFRTLLRTLIKSRTQRGTFVMSILVPKAQSANRHMSKSPPYSAWAANGFPLSNPSATDDRQGLAMLVDLTGVGECCPWIR